MPVVEIDAEKKESQKFMRAVANATESVTVFVPDNLSAEKIHASVIFCCDGMGNIEKASVRTKVVLGRLLVLVKNNPDVYKLAGHKSYDSYIKKEVEGKYNLSHGNVWNAKRIIEKWPSLPMTEYAEVGSEKLIFLAKFCSQDSPNYQKFLDKAKNMTLEKLKKWATDKGLINKGEATGAVIEIGTSAEIKTEWEEFIGNADVQAYVGSASAGEILSALMHECKVEWLEQGAQKSA